MSIKNSKNSEIGWIGWIIRAVSIKFLFYSGVLSVNMHRFFPLTLYKNVNVNDFRKLMKTAFQIHPIHPFGAISPC